MSEKKKTAAQQKELEALGLDDELTSSLRESLLGWFDEHQRQLPWRETDDPYAIWVSEIMLQQTQVITVKAYYERWMELFPDVETLALASIEEVLDAWAGLGYYRRAKFLHRGAQKVVDELDGEIPDSAKGLKKIPGIGPYTAGAIASIAYGEAAPLVDGNVERVFARLFAIAGDPKTNANQKTFWNIAGALVDPEAPGDFNQSLMELGATVCTPKKPTCLLCPVRSSCQGFATGDPTTFPATVKRTKQKKVSVASLVICIEDEGTRSVLLVRRPQDGLLPGLLEFPTSEQIPRADVSKEFSWREKIDAALDAIEVVLPPDARFVPLGKTSHTFSHIKMEMHGFLYSIDTARDGAVDADALKASMLVEGFERERDWFQVDALADAGLSSAQRKIEKLFSQHTSKA